MKLRGLVGLAGRGQRHDYRRKKKKEVSIYEEKKDKMKIKRAQRVFRVPPLAGVDGVESLRGKRPSSL